MNPDDLITKVQAWQANPLLHPLTCGQDSGHRPLVAERDGDQGVILRCLDCDYRQTHIPAAIKE